MQKTQKRPIQKLAYTYEESSIAAGISKRKLVDEVKHGRLPACRIGRSVRILVSDLEKFLESTRS